jgi:hypothetical protein
VFGRGQERTSVGAGVGAEVGSSVGLALGLCGGDKQRMRYQGCAGCPSSVCALYLPPWARAWGRLWAPPLEPPSADPWARRWGHPWGTGSEPQWAPASLRVRSSDRQTPSEDHATHPGWGACGRRSRRGGRGSGRHLGGIRGGGSARRVGGCRRWRLGTLHRRLVRRVGSGRGRGGLLWRSWLGRRGFGGRQQALCLPEWAPLWAIPRETPLAQRSATVQSSSGGLNEARPSALMPKRRLPERTIVGSKVGAAVGASVGAAVGT